MMTGHVSGLPVEELLPVLMSGGGAFLIVRLTAFGARLRPGRDRHHANEMAVFGRQEPWEDSPTGWPQSWLVDGSNARVDGRPIAQWSRLAEGRSDDLSTSQN